MPEASAHGPRGGSGKKKTKNKIVFLFAALQILRRICVLGRVWHENLLGGGVVVVVVLLQRLTVLQLSGQL
jgi:hypothetical protein